ncbi:MAG TPA: P-II family nitrogen regulator [Gemmatimonadaceae bacterium]|jgi:nitrogen regulatory protein P-II 1|nr:P-II family nitrogen regulator [Gemmatimonadaceae bacterium]
MQLLVAVINHEEMVDDILAGFIELGITGATVVRSEGMGRVLSHDVPIFAGVRSLTARSRPTNQTVLSVVDDEKVDLAIALIQEICGSLETPGAGIVFTMPVTRVIGLAAELESDGAMEDAETARAPKPETP